MHSWRRSAAYRIAFAYFGAYAVSLALLGGVIFIVMHIMLTRQLDTTLSNEALTLEAQFRSGGGHELAEAIAERETSGSSTRMLYAVFRPDGGQIRGSFRIRRPAAAGLQDVTFIDPREGPDRARTIVTDLSPGLRLVVGADTDWVERVERIVLMVFGAGFLGACALGFGGAVILGGYLERRLRSINRSAEAIIGGDIRRRMPVGPRRDEFDQLAATLNRMLDRIEGLLENLRQVSSDVAHDLRTPLSRLRTRLEHGAGKMVDAQSRAILEDAVGRVDEVLSLFAAILRIAEVESGETRRFFTTVDVSALLAELAESFAPSFADEGHALLWSIEPDVVIEGDRELIAQAVINLLENAKRHTPRGTVVRMTLVRAGELACIAVADNGPGVPKRDLGRITQRFARLENSRNTSGHGLGLSLVTAVTKLHGGALRLKDAGPGFSATMQLPLNGRTKRTAAQRQNIDIVE